MTDIVCTLTDDDARDRLAEYGRLFAAAYAGRERTTAGMRWSLRADPGIAEWARDLAARERAVLRVPHHRRHRGRATACCGR